MKLEKYDRDCSRILDDDGNVAALIERLSNKLFAIFVDGVRQGTRSFASPQLAFKAWRDKRHDETSQEALKGKLIA